MAVRRALLASAAFTLVAGSAWAETADTAWGRLSLSTGINYSTGKYGQDIATDIVSVPVMAKLEKDSWTLRLTVPYVSVTGPGNVVQGVGTIGTATRARTTEQGLGDVVAAVTRTVYDDPAGGTALDVTGKVKFGTADADKGLGTGEHDFSLALEPSQQWGKVTLFGTLGYKVVGDPEGSDLHNVVFASAGAALPVAAGTSAGLSLDAQTKSSDAASSAPAEVMAFVNHRLSGDWKAQAYVARGLSDASADWSGGATATLTF